MKKNATRDADSSGATASKCVLCLRSSGDWVHAEVIHFDLGESDAAVAAICASRAASADASSASAASRVDDEPIELRGLREVLGGGGGGGTGRDCGGGGGGTLCCTGCGGRPGRSGAASA